MTSLLPHEDINAGRTFLAWVGLALLLFLLALFLLMRVGGYAAPIAAGLLAGASIGKLLGTTASRLRAAAWRPAPAIAFALFLSAATLVALLRVAACGVDGVFTIMAVVALAALAVPAALPMRLPGRGLSGRSEAGLVGGLALLGGVLGYAAADWTVSSRQAHEQEARQAAGYVPPPDPLANAGETKHGDEGRAR